MVVLDEGGFTGTNAQTSCLKASDKGLSHNAAGELEIITIGQLKGPHRLCVGVAQIAYK